MCAQVLDQPEAKCMISKTRETMNIMFGTGLKDVMPDRGCRVKLYEFLFGYTWVRLSEV